MQELSRREREKLNRRAEILQAAWEVFSSRDYHSVTINDIAAAAELSKGTLYLYFRSKADLFFSTFEMGMEKISTIIEEATSSSDDPVVGIREIITRLLGFLDENAGFLRILSSERSHFQILAETRDSWKESLKFKGRIMDMVSHSTTIVADYIQRGIEMGVFRQVAPREAAISLMGIIHGLAREVIETSPTEVSLPERAGSVASILLDGLRERRGVDVNNE